MTYISLPHRRSAYQTGILARLGHAIDVYRERRALARLDGAQLQDIGISAHAAEAEANRPFWDAPARWRD